MNPDPKKITRAERRVIRAALAYSAATAGEASARSRDSQYRWAIKVDDAFVRLCDAADELRQARNDAETVQPSDR